MKITTIRCVISLTLVCESITISLKTRGHELGKFDAGGVVQMIVKADLDTCRRGMEAYVGKRVRLRSSGGRKRTIIQEGVLENCYPNVFTVRCSKHNAYQEMISYSYIDILTRVVEINIEPDAERCEMIH